jgi:hypothetical protein
MLVYTVGARGRRSLRVHLGVKAVEFKRRI